jgi:MoaA/NifB/PqqE/SkfB family radical SAM enzyme
MKGYIRSRIVTKVNEILIKRGFFRLLFPSEIFLHLNSACNAKCSMCPIGRKNADSEFYKLNMTKGNMSRETFENLIIQIKGRGINLSFKNTEALIHPDIDYFLALCKKNKIDCSLTTNGLLLEKHAEAIVKNGVKGLQVSINGYKELHDKVIGIPGAYEKSTAGIKAVNEYKKKYASENPKIKIRMTISPDNYEQLEKSAEDISNIEGINSITITHLEFTENKFKFDLQKMREQTEKVKELDRNISIKPEFSYDELKKYYETFDIMPKQSRCKCTYKSLAVFANGDTGQHVRCFSTFFGNINKMRIFDIWNSEKMINFRKDLWKKDLPKFCRRCCGVL